MRWLTASAVWWAAAAAACAPAGDTHRLQDRAESLIASGNCGQAMQLLAQLISADPSDARARLERADCLLGEGRAADALPDYEGAAAASVSVASLLGATRAAWAQGLTAVATTHLREAQIVASTPTELVTVASVATSYRDPADATKALSRVPEARRDAAWFETAALLDESQEDEPAAVGALTQAISRAPLEQDARLRVELGDVMWAAGEFRQAADQYHYATHLPGLTQVAYARYQAGRCEQRLGDLPAAAADLNIAESSGPGSDLDASIELELLRVDFQQHDPSAALALAARIEDRSDFPPEKRAQAAAVADDYKQRMGT